MPSPDAAAAPELDPEGRFRMGGRISIAVIVTYAILLVLLIVVVAPDAPGVYSWALYVLVGLTLVFLGRYLSTRYTIDDSHLRARTLFGGRRIPLEDVRAIEFASLRDLAPTGGFFAAWGLGGRMFSPAIGEFELVFTDAAKGLLVTAGAYPVYISPRDRDAFARELSRRVRSYTGPLAKDAGRPSGP
jgi:hypothetical protein